MMTLEMTAHIAAKQDKSTFMTFRCYFLRCHLDNIVKAAN
jgi:hypothetical protein